MTDSSQNVSAGERPSPLTCEPRAPTGELIEQRIYQNRLAVINSLGVSELRLFLVQEKLLTVLEAEPISDAACLLSKVEEKARQIGPKAYTVLYRCISLMRNHLGHTYVRALLEGREYATEKDMKQSDMIGQNVLENLREFFNCDFPALTVKMFSKELLTDVEMEQLSTVQVDRSSLLLRLINILNTKGPLAYSLFAECLRLETEHITHAELYDLITQPKSSRKRSREKEGCCSEEVLPVSRHSLSSHKLHGCLQGRWYNALMRRFQSCHHNGKWVELEAEATKLSFSNTPVELQVVGLLESAVSWVFRKEKEKVLWFVGQAKNLLAKVKGDNSDLLEGRSEYILSRLYRYLKQYDEAQKHVEKAVYLLKYAEPGEDSAFVQYCDACIKVERLSEKATVEEIKAAEESYGYAIDHARRHDSGLDLVAPHSLMRLAQMYLGSSHYSAGSNCDSENIQRASECLRQVNVPSLAQRSKCHFYFIQSDLHRSRRERCEARGSANLALDVAEEYNFTLEIGSARGRLDSLTNSY